MRYHITLTQTATIEATSIEEARRMAFNITKYPHQIHCDVQAAGGPQIFPRSYEFQDNKQIDVFSNLANDPKEW